MKTGVLLINLGTPDSPSTADVRKYLREFLMDGRVIDIHPVSRWMLVNLIIAPTRAPKSAALYQKIWTKEGSPLLFHGLTLKAKLQVALGENYHVSFGMRYQSPSIRQALDELRRAQVNSIVVLPLYPQYASSSTGSTVAKLMEEFEKWEVTPELRVISKFHHLDPYLKAVTDHARSFDHTAYDHVLFSFHGLPERHISKSDAHFGDGKCQFNSCCEIPSSGNFYCYRANSFQTANAVAEGLGISKDRYTVSFQSRLGKDPWIKPYSDHEVVRLAKDGKKKILAFSLSFVADCLETTYEVGTEYNELFREHGGDHIHLVTALNSNDKWVHAIKEMITQS